MKLIQLVWSEILGLFVDDEFLAVAVLIVVAASAGAAWLNAPGFAVGTMLVLGLPAILVASLWRTVRRARSAQSSSANA